MAGAVFVGSGVAVRAAASGDSVLFTVRDRDIDEISGMAMGSMAGGLFVHQDALAPAEVYALDEAGNLRLVVSVPGADALDWEDMASGQDEEGRPALFLADTGDAYATRRGTDEPARTTFAVVRFTEPEVRLDEQTGPVVPRVEAQDVVSYPLVYADRAARNAEAMAVQPGTSRVFVVDKIREGGKRRAHLWQTPPTLNPGGENVLERVGTIDITGVSGAAFSPSGSLFVLRDAAAAYVWRVTGSDVETAVQSDPVKIPLPEQKQGESVTFAADGGSLTVGSEGRRQPVFSVPLPATLTEASPTTSAAIPDDNSAEIARGTDSGTGGWAWGIAAAAVVAATVTRVVRSRRPST